MISEEKGVTFFTAKLKCSSCARNFECSCGVLLIMSTRKLKKCFTDYLANEISNCLQTFFYFTVFLLLNLPSTCFEDDSLKLKRHTMQPRNASDLELSTPRTSETAYYAYRKVIGTFSSSRSRVRNQGRNDFTLLTSTFLVYNLIVYPFLSERGIM